MGGLGVERKTQGCDPWALVSWECYTGSGG